MSEVYGEIGPTSDLNAFDAFQILRPLLGQMVELAAACPLSSEDRAALVVMVAGHFVGSACGALQVTDRRLGSMPKSEIARVLFERICDALDRDGAQLQ